MQDAETVQWIPTTTSGNVYGDTPATSSAPVSVLALVAGRTSTENAGLNVPSVIVGKSLYLLDNTILPGASDQFIVRGETYQVEGEAHRWGSMGVEVAIKRTGAKP